jgi:hypothetical protein
MKASNQLFRPGLVAENGEEISLVWIGDDDLAVCINPNSTRVYAILYYNGCGRYEPTIYVSVWSAIRVLLQAETYWLGLRSFPRCAIGVVQFQCPSMAEAQVSLQELLAEFKII